ncbi:MAG: hypothetical protein ABWZ76_07180 [Acidimicrobiales bacterium]
MSRRLTALAVAVIALLAGAGCADDVSPAARVGSTTIANSAFLDEVDAWATLQPDALAGSSDASYSADIVRQLLTQRVEFELTSQAFDEEGLELTEELRDDALASLQLDDPDDAEEAFAPWDEDFASAFVDDIARQIGLQMELDEDYDARMDDAYADADIMVNTRYGSWDAASRQVVAPAGPSQPASADDAISP